MNKIELNNTAAQAEAARVRRGEDAQQAAQAEQAGAKADVRRPDKVTLSERASEAARVTARASELPDIRQERVAELRRQVESGNYKPSASDIADAIFKDEG